MRVPRLWPRGTPARSTVRKWSRRALVAIAVYMIYPVAVTLALATGLIERLIASEDLRVELDAPVWSLLPGDIHLGHVKIFMNGDTQFILRADNVTAQVRLLPLFRRSFEVSSLEADNVIYHMRVQVDDREVDTPRTRAFPPLPGLPGDPTKSKQAAEQTEERGPSWSVRIDGIDADVRELWFFEYRYLGQGRLKGGFERGPEMMRVETSVQDLGPGQLRFGAEHIISKNFQGQIEVAIPELDPRGHADTSFFEFVEGALRLQADIEDFSHLSAYIPGHPLVSGGSGPLSLEARMDRGLLSRDTRVSYETSELRLKGAGYGLQMDWKLLIDMEGGPDPASDPRPRIYSSSESTYVSFSLPGENPFTIQVHGRKESGTLNSARVGGNNELQAARIDWPQIITVDIDDLGRLISAKQSVKTIEGSATGSLLLTLDEKKRMRGPVNAKWEGITLDVQKLRARLNGAIDFTLIVDLGRDRAEIADLKSTFRGGRFQVGSEQVDGYWLNFRSDRVRFVGLPADVVSGDLSISARDAEPVIRVFAADGKIPPVVADIVKLRNLKVIAKLRKKQKALDVMLDTVESDLVDFSGRIFQGPKDSRVALLIGGKTVSLGIDKHGDHTGFEAFAGAEWLNERLRHFPKPVEQVEGQKP